MSGIAYTCRHCGWEVTFEAIMLNGGLPYCCDTAEREYLGEVS